MPVVVNGDPALFVITFVIEAVLMTALLAGVLGVTYVFFCMASWQVMYALK